MLQALEFYEEWLFAGGFVDPAALSLLAPTARNGLFLAGDSSQQVFPKHHSLSEAGLSIAARRYIRKNYRNTRQILEAGLQMLREFGDLQGEESLAAMNPELSVRESAKPTVVSASSRRDEICWVCDTLRLKGELEPHLPVCVVACGLREDDEKRLASVQREFLKQGVRLTLLTQSAKLVGEVFLSTLETVKGYEFSLVINTGCGADQIPDSDMPPKEAWRDARRLYVAMTRARDELIFTHAGEVSRFLRGIQDYVLWRAAGGRSAGAGIG